MAFVQLYMDTTSGLPQICTASAQAEASFLYRKCSKENYISQRKPIVSTLNWIYLVVNLNDSRKLCQYLHAQTQHSRPMGRESKKGKNPLN